MKKLCTLLLSLMLLMTCGMNVALADDPVELTIFLYAPAEFNPDNNPVVQAIEEACNVKLTFEIPPITNYDEKLNLMLVSGDYPDVILYSGHTAQAFLDSVEDGVIVPITDLVENAENIMNHTNSISLDAMRVDGEIYGIPRTSYMRVDGYAVRKDWLDNLGITINEEGMTQDEFRELLRAFTEDDPDGNGIDDTYGFVASSGVIIPEAFGLAEWQMDETGEYYNTYMNLKDDNYYNALSYYGELYRAGYVVPESLTMDSTTKNDMFYQGKVGVSGVFAGAMYSTTVTMQGFDPDAELVYLAGVTHDDGNISGAGLGQGYWWLSAISADCEHPEAVVAMYDWLLSDEGWNLIKYGVEGVHYNMVDGERVATEAFEEYAKYKGYFPGVVRRNDDPDYFVSANAPTEIRTKMLAWLDLAASFVTPDKSMGYVTEASKALSLINLDSEYEEICNGVILGNVTKEEWDDFKTRYFEAGYEAVQEEMNEYLKSVLGE